MQNWEEITLLPSCSQCSSGTLRTGSFGGFQKILARVASSVIFGEANNVGKEELEEEEVMEHHVVPRTAIWVVGTCEAPLLGFPEITCVGGR